MFTRIAGAGTQHLTKVHVVLDRYDITDPTHGLAAETFASASFLEPYDAQLAARSVDLASAYEVGVLVETTDIADLKEAATDLAAPTWSRCTPTSSPDPNGTSRPSTAERQWCPRRTIAIIRRLISANRASCTGRDFLRRTVCAVGSGARAIRSSTLSIEGLPFRSGFRGWAEAVGWGVSAHSGMKRQPGRALAL